MEVLNIYLRVSTQTQSDDGFGLLTQREYGEQLGKTLGMDVRFWDEGAASSSGDELDDRPVLIDLLDAMDKGEVKHLYVYNTDRLSRNTYTWSYIVKKLNDNDVLLYTGRNPQPIDLKDDNQSLLVGILAQISSYENKIRRRRLVTGRLEKVKAGGWHGGPAPFGYEVVDGVLVKHVYEAKWVNHIFEEFVAGKSAKDIQNSLFIKGVRTRRGNAKWSLGSIRSLISNSHYSGSYTFNGIKVRCPQLMSKSLFQAAQKALKSRSYGVDGRVKEGQQKNQYLVKDFLVCKHCGSKFGARRNKIQYYDHYYCRGKEEDWRSVNDASLPCKDRVRSIRIPVTDKVVWDAVLNTIKESHLFKEVYKKEILGSSISLSDRNALILNNKKKIKKKEKEIGDIIKHIATNEASRILKRKGKAELDALLSVFEDEKLKLEVEIEAIHKQNDNLSSKSEWVDWVKMFGEKIEHWSSGDFSFEEKQVFLKQHIEKVVVESKDKSAHSLKIHFKMPYVDDKFEWKFKNVKGKMVKDGYEIFEGRKILILLPEQDSQLKKAKKTSA